MNYYPGRAALACDPYARANLATCIATTAEGTDTQVHVPEPLYCRGRNLFATAVEAGGVNPDAERLAERHSLNQIVGHIDPSQPMLQTSRYRLGLKLFWKTLWFDNYRLWLPETGLLACFISADPSDLTWFWVEDGDLMADRGRPYADEADRHRGIVAAARMMSRWMRGR